MTSVMLSDKGVGHGIAALERGMHFFLKLAADQASRNASDPHEICELAYRIRCLAELCSAFPLWFRSYKNAEALGAAAFLDVNHLFVRRVKLRQSAGKELSDMERKILHSAEDKYFSLAYPETRLSVCDQRRADELFADTNVLTSKIAHQDEASVFGRLGSDPFKNLIEHVPSRLMELARFWRMDFIAQVYFMQENVPEILAAYIQKHGSLPFTPALFSSEA